MPQTPGVGRGCIFLRWRRADLRPRKAVAIRRSRVRRRQHSCLGGRLLRTSLAPSRLWEVAAKPGGSFTSFMLPVAPAVGGGALWSYAVAAPAGADHIFRRAPMQTNATSLAAAHEPVVRMTVRLAGGGESACSSIITTTDDSVQRPSGSRRRRARVATVRQLSWRRRIAGELGRSIHPAVANLLPRLPYDTRGRMTRKNGYLPSLSAGRAKRTAPDRRAAIASACRTAAALHSKAKERTFEPFKLCFQSGWRPRPIY